VFWSVDSTGAGVLGAPTCTVGSGSDTCPVTYHQAAAGAVTITAVYVGDTNNIGSSGSATVTYK
jgi:hypothetical protein